MKNHDRGTWKQREKATRSSALNWRMVRPSTEHSRGHLRVRSLEGRGRVWLPRAYVEEDVALAYAVTTYKAQGMTVDRGLLLADEATSDLSLYVGMTRGRHSNDVFVGADLGLDYGPADDPPTPVEILQGVLRRDTAERSATDVLRDVLTDDESIETLLACLDRVEGHVISVAGPTRTNAVPGSTTIPTPTASGGTFSDGSIKCSSSRQSTSGRSTCRTFAGNQRRQNRRLPSLTSASVGRARCSYPYPPRLRGDAPANQLRFFFRGSPSFGVDHLGGTQGGLSLLTSADAPFCIRGSSERTLGVRSDEQSETLARNRLDAAGPGRVVEVGAPELAFGARIRRRRGTPVVGTRHSRERFDAALVQMGLRGDDGLPFGARGVSCHE
jgi:hypothetical protein